VARTVAAEMLAEMTISLGPDRVFADREKATSSVLVTTGVALLLDGSLDTRTQTKRMFKALAKDERYVNAVESLATDREKFITARKTLRQLAPDP
jgi:hypothetical protein